jgi:hypothetical protein
MSCVWCGEFSTPYILLVTDVLKDFLIVQNANDEGCNVAVGSYLSLHPFLQKGPFIEGTDGVSGPP